MEAAAEPLRDGLAEWLDRVGVEHLAGAEPAIPDGVADRAAEVWEPLLAIADLAGDHWPDTARAAAIHFVTTTAATTGSSIGTRLLADLRTLFHTAGTDRMETADIIGQLLDSEDGSWGDLDGRPLDARRLAREMARYNVRPKDLKLPSGSVRKGYRTDGPDGLADVWLRYLPPAATSATTATPQVNAVAAQPAVAATSATGRDPDQPPTPPGTCRADHPPRVGPAASRDQVADVAATTPPTATHLTRAVAEVAAVADTHGEEDR